MKKLLCMMLSMGMLLLFTACGSSAGNTSQSQTPAPAAKQGCGRSSRSKAGGDEQDAGGLFFLHREYEGSG